MKNSNNGFWLNCKEKFENGLIKTGEEIRLLFTYRKVISELRIENDSLECQIMNKDKKISSLKNKKVNLVDEKDNLLKLQEGHIQVRNETIKKLKTTITQLKKELNVINENLQIESKKAEEVQMLQNKCKKLRLENDNLSSRLILLEEEKKALEGQIEFLKTNRRAPSKEEILAYEYRRNEVMKKIKNQK